MSMLAKYKLVHNVVQYKNTVLSKKVGIVLGCISIAIAYQSLHFPMVLVPCRNCKSHLQIKSQITLVVRIIFDAFILLLYQ